MLLFLAVAIWVAVLASIQIDRHSPFRETQLPQVAMPQARPSEEDAKMSMQLPLLDSEQLEEGAGIPLSLIPSQTKFERNRIAELLKVTRSLLTHPLLSRS